MKQFLLSLFVLMSSAYPVLAEPISRGDVERHLQAMVDLYNKDKIDNDEIYVFVKRYTIDEGLYRNDVYIDENEPVIKSQTKEQILGEMRENSPNYVAATAKYKINSFKPNADNSEADVNYTVWHDATTKQTDPVGKREMLISFTSVSTCDETFALRGTQVVGLKNVCEVRMKGEKPVPAATGE
jgi:glycerol-3-phosphate dehydrogenase